MNVSKFVTGIDHIGIPTNNMAKTVEFYESLGFEVTLRTRNGNEDVCFLQLKNLVIETYENGRGAGEPGALDHVALTVSDVEEAYKTIKEGNYEIIDSEIQQLPFWDKGVRFFKIKGPNAEIVEFLQKL